MTKLMVFNKRKRKSEKNEWNWEGRKIEQVNEFKYLCSGMCLGNKREKVGGDITRRMMMSESMVESILMYGAEIWGWKE
jgi:hypothetical protein